MISVSSDIKQAIQNYPANVSAKIVFTLADNNSLTVTSANIWQGSLVVEDSVSSDNNFEIGSTHIGQMSVSLLDDGTMSSVEFMDATAVLWLAPYGQDYIQKGVYTVVKCDRRDGAINITAYDNMYKLSQPFSESTLVYPTTLAAILSDAQSCGISLDTTSTNQFAGYDTVVSEKPSNEGLTYREVVGYIAQQGGYNVRFDRLGKLTLVRFAMSAFDVSGAHHEIDSIYNFNHSFYEVAITGIKCSVTTEVSTTDPDTGEVTTESVTTDYTSGTDDYQIVLAENPFITSSNAQTVVNMLLHLYGGVPFYVGDVSHSSDWTIEASDVAVLTDRNGNAYNFLVSATTFGTGAAQLTKSNAEEPFKKIQPTVIDRIASSVRQASLDAKNAQNKGNYAAQIAGNTNQYFWHTSTGNDTGAHITEIPQDEFLETPSGGNLLARSNGAAVRNGMTELAQFTSSAVNFLDGLGNNSSNIVATFGSSSARIGKASSYNTEITTSGFNVRNNGTTLASFGSSVILGQSAAPHLTINSSAVTFYNDSNRAVAKISAIDQNYDIDNGRVTLGGSNIYLDGMNDDMGGSYAIIHASRKNSSYEAHILLESANDIKLNAPSTEASGTVTSWGAATVHSSIYADWSVYSGGKTSPTDGVTGAVLGADGTVRASTVLAYTPTWSSGETPSNYHCVVSAGICSFFYMGAGVAHSAGTQLAQLPVGARPSSQVYCPFVKMTGNAVGTISITTAGVVTVAQISSTSATGRIYFNCSFPIV